MPRTIVMLPFALAGAAMLTAGCTTGPARTPAQGAAAAAPAPDPPVETGTLSPDRDMVANLARSPSHAMLARALTAAGLDRPLGAPGPFTLFAPTDAAFSRLSPGGYDTLLQPANRANLVRVLTYHALPGVVTAADLRAQIAAGNGRAELRTIANQPLIATAANDMVVLTDVHGNHSFLTHADLRQANGVIHIVNGVLLPRLD